MFNGVLANTELIALLAPSMEAANETWVRGGNWWLPADGWKLTMRAIDAG
jgi:hypothetical protein